MTRWNCLAASLIGGAPSAGPRCGQAQAFHVGGVVSADLDDAGAPQEVLGHEPVPEPEVVQLPEGSGGAVGRMYVAGLGLEQQPVGGVGDPEVGETATGLGEPRRAAAATPGPGPAAGGAVGAR
jgi:hypothetical protein